jgi:hypothetical protein
MQQLQLLLNCEAPQLLQLCLPVSVTQSSAVQTPASEAEVAEGGAAAAAGAAAPRAAVLCAVTDALEVMSSAGVELLTASLKCGMHMAAAQQQQQQQGSAAQQRVECSHWLSQQWARAAAIHAPDPGSIHEVQQATSVPHCRLQCDDSVSFGAARLPAVAKKLLLVVTGCIKQLRNEW